MHWNDTTQKLSFEGAAQWEKPLEQVLEVVSPLQQKR